MPVNVQNDQTGFAAGSDPYVEKPAASNHRRIVFRRGRIFDLFHVTGCLPESAVAFRRCTCHPYQSAA